MVGHTRDPPFFHTVDSRHSSNWAHFELEDIVDDAGRLESACQ